MPVKNLLKTVTKRHHNPFQSYCIMQKSRCFLIPKPSEKSVLLYLQLTEVYMSSDQSNDRKRARKKTKAIKRESGSLLLCVSLPLTVVLS